MLPAFAGIAVAFGEGWNAAAGTWIGDALGLLAAIFWAATIVTVRATPLARASAAKVLRYQLGGAVVIALPLSWLAGEEGIKGGMAAPFPHPHPAE
ncbi:MAG: hypothetical protein Q8O25_07760 [Sulfurisoma sp.]|nr:hypothetical protein [Sulfurisoma sp.]